MKLKLTILAACTAGLISAQAATSPAVVKTNDSAAEAMTKLFGDPVIVKGTGFELKRSALDEVVSGARANAAAQGQQLPPDFQVSVLNQLVTIQLLLQKATPADRVTGKNEADLQFTNLLKRFGSQEAFQRQLTAVGMTVDDLRGKAMQEAVAKATLKRELNINVSDADAQAYYTNHAADFEEPELAHVRHILLMTIDPANRAPLSTNTIAAKRKQIEELLKRAKAGEDFGALAKQYSEDPGSKENNGELPEFPRGQMVPEFEAAAFSLTSNQISDVITTAYGFHIIKMLEKKGAKKVDYATAAADIKEGLGRMKIAKVAPTYIKNLRTEYKVEILDPGLKAMDQAAQDAAAAAPVAPETSK
jgi:parvulin-like peptidyl-prolyl isomerase